MFALFWAQELSRKGLAPADIDFALQSVFGEDMRVRLDFTEDADDERPVGPGAEFSASAPPPYPSLRRRCRSRHSMHRLDL